MNQKREVPMIYRHGDLLLKPIAALPSTAKKARDNILARGEVTGHHHELHSKQICVYEQGEQKFVALQKATKLTHQEHNTLTLLPGTYELIHEREFDPFVDEIRKVMD